ncbi:haloacid dehalogenase superfamily, subfamily IA, variant 3 with third motif having DD or ED [Sphingomonas guangdongensis]|uniref:Haloacid dehalogenase superfamily, subfamily IA, variant 3 with third motif having DD or ED n=1 Tax=Sphingomonas guangdongensis TaxID=1141890 RepID=A0A285QG52_9SPHN|nr:HAD family phosphatase [Sphingomonas guangdongensis]SOB80409.1 haloacid dehalogenase superfamily, subfamily IA, variant 3 with third motif having DD or ED [Sphingomonas guangdongensis]
MLFKAILFDFDGVLIESEAAGNRHIADYLSGIGHPTSAEESMAHFMGLAGADFIGAVERWIGRTLPDDFAAARKLENDRTMREGVGEVAGAVAFVRSLPPTVPKAIVSSSSTAWIRAHLDHIGLRAAFEPHIYSGKEHVARGKPAPDLYLYGAAQLGIDIADCAIIEDSPVGATGAVASGAYVIGLCAGSHCGVGHAERLKAIGVDAVAADFATVSDLLV